ncbi:hypothetical protein EG830_08190 [bacterium]|nr:hypothetical protein [bacterium]
METKDIVILAAVFALSGYSLYRRYTKKNGGTQGAGSLKNTSKNSLKDQADDYEPYAGKGERTE